MIPVRRQKNINFQFRTLPTGVQIRAWLIGFTRKLLMATKRSGRTKRHLKSCPPTPSDYKSSIPLDPGAANEGASAPSFVTRQFSEVSAADWLRRPSVPTVRWGFLIPEWGSRQRPWPVR